MPADKLDPKTMGTTAVWYVQIGPLLAALAPILVGLLTVPAVAVFQAMRGPVVPRLGGRDAQHQRAMRHGGDRDLGTAVAAQMHEVRDRLPVAHAALARYGFVEA